MKHQNDQFPCAKDLVKSELPEALNKAKSTRGKKFNNANRKDMASYLVLFLSEYIPMSERCYKGDQIDWLCQAKSALMESKAIDEAFGRARGYLETYERSNPRAISNNASDPHSFRNRQNIQEFSLSLDWGMANYDAKKWKDILEQVSTQAGQSKADPDALEKLTDALKQLIHCPGVQSTKPVQSQVLATPEPLDGWPKGPAHLDPGSAGQLKGSVDLDSGFTGQPDNSLVSGENLRWATEASEYPSNTDTIQAQVEEARDKAMAKILNDSKVTLPQPDSTIAECPSWVTGDTVQPEGSAE